MAAQLTPSKQSDQWNWNASAGGYQRSLGASEEAFYPASQSGLGDMFLHIAFTAPVASLDPERVARAWAIIRKRHPLLLCKIACEEHPKMPYFLFVPPKDVDQAVQEARNSLTLNSKSKDELIFEYMNGPRSLSDNFISSLTISTSDNAVSTPEAQYNLLMCAPHFLGDGTSLHIATHDLLTLLAGPLSNAELEKELADEVDWLSVLPPAFESRLGVPTSRFSQAAVKVDFARMLQREIGGHTLPRKQRGPQKTVMYEVSFSESETEMILKRCKSKGVTVNHALVAVCNLVWARNFIQGKQKELPLMMYTAINLRPFLSSHPTNTYWFVALTYFNIVLPSFLPSTQEVLWHRAREVKKQLRKMVDSPFLKSRALNMANIRIARSRGEKVEVPTLSAIVDDSSSAAAAAAPSAALLGLSLIGNLDAIYTRPSYPSFTLHSVTTASRQKASGLLLLEHTFGKKLWLNLCWDENGFEEGVIEKFWKGLEDGVRELVG
ncbi:hypothetical protein CPC08DRAFT_715049 [Agrocybe pediades]|nr:hypothetical protein CPC08DRAFT_715049 [Agrocybe pediades]